eukprot:356152-Chlamydomonas_euryale.AAC.6
MATAPTAMAPTPSVKDEREGRRKGKDVWMKMDGGCSCRCLMGRVSKSKGQSPTKKGAGSVTMVA